MNVQFQYDTDEYDKACCFYSLDFPNVTFQIGDTLFLYEFKSLLKVGEIYMPDADEEFFGWNMIDYNSEITAIQHAYVENIGYVLLIVLVNI